MYSSMLSYSYSHRLCDFALFSFLLFLSVGPPPWLPFCLFLSVCLSFVEFSAYESSRGRAVSAHASLRSRSNKGNVMKKKIKCMHTHVYIYIFFFFHTNATHSLANRCRPGFGERWGGNI